MPERNLSIPEYLNLLKQGNQRWKTGNSTNWLSTPADDLVEAQTPYAVIIACADSRVVPEFIFDSVLGELFVIRIAGNIVTPEVVASIEFATDALGIKLVIVLGHQNCGAVTGKLNSVRQETPAPTPNMSQMFDQIQLAPKDQDLFEHIKANTNHQATEIFKLSSLLVEANKDEHFAVLSAYYKLDEKEVIFFP
ncbi:MAG: carbonic anhydrase [Candidatus Kariarchaeaceae archaeon]|jgi:carbonic anhydrase